ncbi:MFS transporter [Pelagicoccus mobilis]|uniref:MFS transporter n=1 Tax=Pelagicoccus mobilis TaxID=415221 RepID=A0A934RZM3_9BACT|nr:glycoside-pentoside-hexuronide (GPH):cation symporter [Pelagicoccus mobilis]MBK1876408.1 MFS transporter [Pelagicoccus mobilis]
MSIESNVTLSKREKFGYSLADGSANFVFQVLLAYQQPFFIEVFGLGPTLLFWLLLGGRLFDAITDPAMGMIADRTKSRWGQFRPWILWSAIPFAGVFWLTFTKPDLGPTGLAAYAVICYLLLMAVYTMNNVPYAALAGVMTGDPEERTSIQQWRFFTAMSAAFVVQSFTIPWVAKFGGGDEAKGWSITIGIFAAISFLFFIGTFLTTRERVPQTKSVPIKDDIKNLKRNRPWIILFFVTLFIFITLAFRGGPMYYFMSFYMEETKLVEFISKMGFVAPSDGELGLGKRILDTIGLLVKPDHSNGTAVAIGVFGMCGNVITLIGIAFSKKIVHTFGKKPMFIVCLSGTTLVTASIFLVNPDQVGLLFFLSMLWPATYGPTVPVLWVMIADTADFSEWKTGRRATGFVFAGIVFALKAGLALGAAFGAKVMEWHGYVSGAADTLDSQFAIKVTATLYSALPFAVAVGFLLLYPIGNKLNDQMNRELKDRRAQTS